MTRLSLGIVLSVVGISLGAFQVTTGRRIVPHLADPVVFTTMGVVLVALKHGETTSD